MKKHVLKVIFLTMVAISIIFIFTGKTFAEGGIDPETYKPSFADRTTGAYQVKKIGNSIIGILQIVGSILSVAVLAVLGIKYMLGSAEEKAEYKKTMGPYILGAIMVFSITNLLGIIATISQNLWGTT